MDYKIVRLIDKPEIKEEAAQWFHEKWNIPLAAYKESMEECLAKRDSVPQWYVALEDNRIIGGLGVIENDFHDRKDLTPNVCAVYVEEDKRSKGVAGVLLDYVCADMKEKGIDTLYLVTDHTSFYERYGWEFLCMVQGDGEPDMTRMYIHRVRNFMETQDIVLRKGVFDDWRDLLRNIDSRDESAKYMLWNPIYDEEHARENAKKMVEFQLTHDAWLVYEKKSDQAIGWTGVTEIDKKVWKDTGIAIGPDFTGKGYGKQVLQCMMYYVFEEKKADKMVCSCRSKNTASKALCQGSGFVYRNSEDKLDPRNGEKYVLEYYELSRKRYLEGEYLDREKKFG